jgi:hypothetical protein
VARACPELARCLGERFDSEFRDFALTTPPPAKGGPLEDGLAFSKTLDPSDLDDSARLELAWARLANVSFGLRLVRLIPSRRLVLAAKLPCLGVRLIWLPCL